MPNINEPGSLEPQFYESSGLNRLPTFMDFFAGAGLVRLGLEPAWKCLWANDISSSKQQIYIENFGADQFLLKDIENIHLDEIPQPVDMVWASFPCQDLSLAGWQRGMSAERSGTFGRFGG